MELIIQVPDGLTEDLQKACKQTGCNPSRFAAEVLESELAARRLPTIPESGGKPHGTVKD
jgi:hypothetical protein